MLVILLLGYCSFPNRQTKITYRCISKKEKLKDTTLIDEGGIAMASFQDNINEYRNQLKKASVKVAYQGLMKYIDDLRLHLKNRCPDFFLSDVHYGQMDYTYFYFFPQTLKRRNLKVMVLFIHDTFRFEVMLAGYNKEVQTKYLKLLKENGWSKYPLATSTKGVEYISKFVLVDNPDFGNLEALTGQIEAGALKFIKDTEEFLSKK
jgi:hypothetical protein